MKNLIGLLGTMASIITIYQFIGDQFLSDLWLQIFIAGSGFLLGAFFFKSNDNPKDISYISRLHLSRFIIAITFIFSPIASS